MPGNREQAVRRGTVRSKANSGVGLCGTIGGERGRSPYDEKQSQLPGGRQQGAGSQMRERAKQSQIREEWGIWGKANVACGAVPPEGRVCETKPIFGRRQGQDGLATCVWLVVQNKANLSCRTGGGQSPRYKATVRNKANCRIAAKKSLCFMVV